MENDWISCEERLPEMDRGYGGTYSRVVLVRTDTGKIAEDFLIGGKWVYHCRLDKIGGYPVAWKELKWRIIASASSRKQITKRINEFYGTEHYVIMDDKDDCGKHILRDKDSCHVPETRAWEDRDGWHFGEKVV